MLKLGELELSKPDLILIVDGLVKTIGKHTNKFSIVFRFDDIVISVLNIILFIKDNIDEIFPQVSKLRKRIIENGYQVDKLSQLNQILELNPTYQELFNNAKNEVKYKVFDFLNQYKNKLSYLYLDFDSEEIQVQNIDAFSEINSEYMAQRRTLKIFPEKTSQNASDLNFLINELKRIYETAPEGYQMTHVHLFGIKYSNELKNKPLKKIAIEATGKESLYVEINKGMKLSNYVVEKSNFKINDSIDIDFNLNKDT